MIAFVLLTALAFPPLQNSSAPKTDAPVSPEQVLAWQLEGLTQEELREEVTNRGLTDYPEIAFLSALSAAGADQETIRVVRHAKGPRKLWKWDFGLPKPTDYLYQVAGALMWGDLDDALATMQREVVKQPRNSDVRLIYAHLLRVQGDWIAAYGEATEAIKLAPRSPYAHGLRSTICYHARLASCASREAAHFIAMRSQDAAAYIVLGHAHELQGNDQEALQAYAQAERLHAEYSAIYAGMAAVYFHQGEFEAAVRAYERAIKIDANLPDYHCQLAQVYLSEGYTREAIEQLQRAKELAPGNLQISFALANAYLMGERYSAAIKEYRELVQQDPDLLPAREQLAKALRAEGRIEEAAQIYREIEANAVISKQD